MLVRHRENTVDENHIAKGLNIFSQWVSQCEREPSTSNVCVINFCCIPLPFVALVPFVIPTIAHRSHFHFPFQPLKAAGHVNAALFSLLCAIFIFNLIAVQLFFLRILLLPLTHIQTHNISMTWLIPSFLSYSLYSADCVYFFYFFEKNTRIVWLRVFFLLNLICLLHCPFPL